MCKSRTYFSIRQNKIDKTLSNFDIFNTTIERSYGKLGEVIAVFDRSRSYGTIVMLHSNRYFRKNKVSSHNFP